ncbi:MAG: hypothetical protein LBU12_06760 [Deltaproteobacteria bacterium]|jgi:hypothetical protein|nr:hypothetical protein [Deltaproteobacteria bacterium]
MTPSLVKAAGRRLETVVLAADRVRWAARFLNFAAILVLWALQGPFWAWGALMGGLVLEANLTLFKRFAASCRPGPLTTSLWATLLRFYLAFAGTVLYCLAVVKFGLGAPIAFLLALVAFIPAIVLGLLSCLRAFRAASAVTGAGEASAGTGLSAAPPDGATDGSVGSPARRDGAEAADDPAGDPSRSSSQSLAESSAESLLQSSAPGSAQSQAGRHAQSSGVPDPS